MEVVEFEYNLNTYHFYLERKNVKNINIKVKPNLSIEVSASQEVPLNVILQKVKKRFQWINKNLNYFKKSQSMSTYEKEYVSGETFKYLGKQYRLKIIKSNEEEYVKYIKGFIYIFLKNPNNTQRKKQLLKSWYQSRSEIIFKNSLNRMHSLIEKQLVEKPTIKIRSLKSRWGSCFRTKNQIILNSDLIEAPKFCIDYVVLHELIHFKFEHHNKEFYTLLSVLMPDWKKRKQILDFDVIREL